MLLHSVYNTLFFLLSINFLFQIKKIKIYRLKYQYYQGIFFFFDVEYGCITHIALAKGEDMERLLKEFENRKSELKNGAWKQGWHEFCLSKKEQYVTYIGKAGRSESTEIDNAVFGHYLDCEAHTDVWRELFPTWNQTNCIDE